jgi:hypothetical protein
MRRFILLAVLVLSLAAGPTIAWASESGSFLSVKGKVQVKNTSGDLRSAKTGIKVTQEERVVTGKDAEATLQFFDGSQVALKPGTEFQLVKLEKPSAEDKVLQFKILVGGLLAKVKKLSTSRSSFEIEGGGVVCGVRGTEFSMRLDSAQHLALHVSSGSVYAKTGGHTVLFNAGDTGRFTNGKADPSPANKGDKQGLKEGPPGKPLSQDPALKDLKAQFVKGLQTNHDNAFTDPAVGGLSLIPLNVLVANKEAVP